MNTRTITALTLSALVCLTGGIAQAEGSVSTTLEMKTKDGRTIVFEGKIIDQGYPELVPEEFSMPGSVCVANVFNGDRWVQVWSHDYGFYDNYVGEWCDFYDMFGNRLSGTIN